MTSTPLLSPHVAAVVDLLDGGGLTVGDHAAPDADLPYVVVYLIPGGSVTGTAAEPSTGAELIFQTTSVGRLAAEALDLDDQVTALLDGTRLDVDGHAPQVVRLLTGSGGVLRDDSAGTPDRPLPPLFYAQRRWVLWTFTDPTAGS